MEKENKNEGIRKKERAEIRVCKNRVPRGGSNPPQLYQHMKLESIRLKLLQ